MTRPINKLTQGLATLLLGGFAVALSSDGSCASSQIQVFAPLSTISAAQAYCSSAYPQLAVTTTVTVPVTSSITSLATVTTPSTTTEVEVVSTTETETATTTTSVTTTSTITVTVTTSAVAKRTIGCHRKSQMPSGYSASGSETYSLPATTSAAPTASSASSAPSSSSTVDLFSSLVSADPSIQSIACSCIETAAVITATETAIVTNEVAVTSTVADIQTVHVTSAMTITSTTTETATSTLTTTTTTTTYVAEPTSCADVGSGGSYTADNGETFTVSCGHYYSGSNSAIVISTTYGYTYKGCLEACSANSACLAINFVESNGDCVLLRALGTLATLSGLSCGAKQ